MYSWGSKDFSVLATVWNQKYRTNFSFHRQYTDQEICRENFLDLWDADTVGQILKLMDCICLSSWLSKGFISVTDLYSDGLLKSFSTLQTQFSLPNLDNYKYAQITHCLLQNLHLFKTIYKIGWDFLTITNPSVKSIYIFYNLLQDKASFSPSWNGKWTLVPLLRTPIGWLLWEQQLRSPAPLIFGSFPKKLLSNGIHLTSNLTPSFLLSAEETAGSLVPYFIPSGCVLKAHASGQ